MKKILSLSLLLLTTNLFSQVLTDTTMYYEIAKAGTVKEITNESVCAIVVFISGPEGNWKPKKKQSILKRNKRFFKKLNREFQEYGVDFQIHFEPFNMEKDFEIDSIIDYSNPTGLSYLERLASFKDSNAKEVWNHYTNSQIPFFKEKQYLNYKGGYFVILYQEGLGQTTASPALLNGFEDRQLPEFITVFEYDPNRRKLNKYVTVHETLHLFGAWDLYKSRVFGPPESNFEKAEAAYPISIMRDSKKITVDPITAWRIGINNKPEEWFFNLVPKAYFKSSYDAKGNFIFK